MGYLREKFCVISVLRPVFTQEFFINQSERLNSTNQYPSFSTTFTVIFFNSAIFNINFIIRRGVNIKFPYAGVGHYHGKFSYNKETNRWEYIHYPINKRKCSYIKIQNRMQLFENSVILIGIHLFKIVH